MSTVLMSVGDTSGDAHGADFVQALRALRPGTRFVGMGGTEMEKEGVEILVRQREIAVGGLVELLPDLHRIVAAWRRMGAALREMRPDLVVLIDSSGFNLPLARRARRLQLASLYYVSPQAWAWRPGRIRKLAKRVDRLASILPFEPPLYDGTGLPVEFVGHPLVERLEASSISRDEARRRLGLPADARVVALMPGSRRGEIRLQLPLYLEVAKRLHARDPRIHFALPRAPAVEREALEAGIRAARLPSLLLLDVVEGSGTDVLRAADVALAKPGTTTLEAALLSCPLVVSARASRITAAIVRRLVRVDSFVMPNLIAGEPVVPEYLQEQALPEPVAEAVLALLEGPAREDQLARLRVVRDVLSRRGASRRAAEIAVEMLVGRLAG